MEGVCVSFLQHHEFVPQRNHEHFALVSRSIRSFDNVQKQIGRIGSIAYNDSLPCLQT